MSKQNTITNFSKIQNKLKSKENIMKVNSRLKNTIKVHFLF